MTRPPEAAGYLSRYLWFSVYDKAEDLKNEEKEDLAFEIADQYHEEPEKFLESFIRRCFSRSGKHIQKPGNLL